MKTLLLTVSLILMTTFAQAQCIGEIKDVIQDTIRGSIIVQTEYTLNGKVIQQGQTRYLETSGTSAEIIAKAKEDIAEHCENLIKRIPENEEYIKANMLSIQKTLTAPIITEIKPSLVGYKSTKTEAINTFKGKDIKVTYDEKNLISDSIAVIKQ